MLPDRPYPWGVNLWPRNVGDTPQAADRTRGRFFLQRERSLSAAVLGDGSRSLPTQLSIGNIHMNNPDRQLDRSLEEYLRSFVAENIVLQEAIKRLEQGMIPADFDRRVNDRRAAFKTVKS